MIKDLIERGDLVIDNPLAPSNQNLNVYKDPLPRQNQVDENQVNYVNPSLMTNFVGMIHAVMRNQKCPPLNHDASTSHQTQRHNDSIGLSQGPKGPTQQQNQRHPIVILKSMITHQLKSSPTKMTIYDLLQTSKAHRDALMDVLKSIEVQA